MRWLVEECSSCSSGSGRFLKVALTEASNSGDLLIRGTALAAQRCQSNVPSSFKAAPTAATLTDGLRPRASEAAAETRPNGLHELDITWLATQNK